MDKLPSQCICVIHHSFVRRILETPLQIKVPITYQCKIISYLLYCSKAAISLQVFWFFFFLNSVILVHTCACLCSADIGWAVNVGLITIRQKVLYICSCLKRFSVKSKCPIIKLHCWQVVMNSVLFFGFFFH